jgi:hypothetical protein
MLVEGGPVETTLIIKRLKHHLTKMFAESLTNTEGFQAYSK